MQETLQERIARLEENIKSLDKRLEENIKNLDKSIGELKDANKRVEEKLDEYLEKISSMRAMMVAITFAVASFVSGVIGFFFKKSGG